MPDNDAELTFGREIRFAVVMYGGVSLAIYINGVAQELLKMCRATDKTRKTGDLEADEKIYRQIAALLADEELLNHYSNLLAAAEIENDAARAREQEERARRIKAKLEERIENDDFEMTRLVVDILTGTSAGGINAIFLAKALANNQEIGQLKDLWLSEGDISVLINDRKSVADIPLTLPDKAKSLLNSDRMYLKLLEAFDGMGSDLKENENSPFVEDLDLFVPTTDFQGTVVPLRLLDDVVEEKRFRQVFHFRYQTNGTNDFEKKNNAMLAVAARATSSFPFAFEPMRLSRAEKIIDAAFPDSRTRIEELKAASEKFFPKIIQKNGDPIAWIDRDLVDGGVLDNKPFGYAIDVLSKRRADFQVERKLLYIEPSPESFSKNDNSNLPPDVLENAAASLSAIPSYETIREDLERLLERNKLIERVNRLITGAENDVFEFLTIFGNKEENTPNPNLNWYSKGLEDIVDLKGRAVLTYYRLRIAELTDELAKLVSRMIGVGEESEYFQIVRTLVRGWREDQYGNYKGEKSQTTMAFLGTYDLNYRLRRLRLVQQKANALYDFDEAFAKEFEKRQQILENLVNKVEERAIEQAQQDKKSAAQMQEAAKAESRKLEEHPFIEKGMTVSQSYLDWLEAPQKSMDAPLATPTEKGKTKTVTVKPTKIIWSVFQQEDGKTSGREQIRLAAGYFQYQLKTIYKDLLKQRENLLFEPSSFSDLLKTINISGEELEKLQAKIESQGDVDVSEMTGDRLKELVAEFPNLFSQIKAAAGELRKVFDGTFRTTRENARKILSVEITEMPAGLKDKGVDLVLLNAVRGYLENYYENFDDYDQISFPIFYQTLIGEAVKVDVMRISPQDAKLLNGKVDRKKVAGEKLFHFGAFLDRVWRKNDIMWGRLDGAERLMTALLPEKKHEKLREFFIKQAHEAILKEEFHVDNEVALRGTLADSLIKVSSGLPLRDVIDKVTASVGDEAVKKKLTAILGTLFKADIDGDRTESQVYEYVKNFYQYDEKLEPKDLLRVISRSTKVTGDIFEGIAEEKAAIGSRMRWIARLGQLFWGLVEVATPNTLANLIALHLLKLVYAFEVVLIVGSTIFNRAEVQQFGIVALVLTLILHLTAVTLNDYMRGNRLLDLFKVLAVTLVVILSITGVLFFLAFFFQNELWSQLVEGQKTLAGFTRIQKLLPISLVVAIFSSIFIWNKSRTLDIRYFGRIALIYIALAVALGFVFQLIPQHAHPSKEGLKPGLALELVRSADDFNTIIGKQINTEELSKLPAEARASFNPEAARSELKLVQILDSFIFIPLYVGFLLFFSKLLILRRGEWVKYVLRALVIAIICAGLADFIENFFSFWLLEQENSAVIPQWVFDTVRYSATFKWFLLSIVTIFLSLIFWRSYGRKAK